MIVAVKANTFKIHELIQDPEIRQKSYLYDPYVQDVKKLLGKYEEMGYFNDL